jgi:sugar (pentulose or hexulose) kinase
VTEYVLTIDLGTSGPKVAIFTFDGSFVDGDFTPVDLNVLADGGVEQSPAAWWNGVVAASQRHTAARCDHLDGRARRGRDPTGRRRRAARPGL